jgi:hypothetical protein
MLKFQQQLDFVWSINKKVYDKIGLFDGVLVKDMAKKTIGP